MRVPLIATAALIVALAALVVSGSAGEELLPFTIGSAAAAVLVAFAAIYQSRKPRVEIEHVPIEDFSLWTDIGEPAAGLRRLGGGQTESAFRITSADLSSLASNAGLLSERLSILIGRHGFDELTRSKLHRNAHSLLEGISSIVKKMRSGEDRSTENVQRLLDSIEGCAAQSDRIANKLYDSQREKSEIIRTYTDPLRRAAEKLSRDLRLANTNLRNYLKGAEEAAAS
ncbi:MAG: hypothetical protein AVW06_00710 [Hadesarchaea archaeon DG-33-1]|nr:MAG: hypothetical protein AVW06_00710 [Hadesarchaea archaeon DG-33-1]